MKQLEKPSVVIADDHPIVRKGIRDIIAEDGRFVIAEEVGSGDRVCESVRKHMPALLLLDLNMPKMHGLEVIKHLRSERLPTAIVVMTMHREDEIIDAVRDLGVKGYLLKESAEDNLIHCMEKVLEGEYFLSPELSNYLMGRTQRRESILRENPRLTDLTPSERQVLGMIARHLTSREIADALHISVNTVNNHRNNICRKLDLHGINGLLKFAIENKVSI